MTLTELRSKFPPTRDTVYVNHAATAPLSTPVMEAAQSYLADRHRTNVENDHSFAPLVESARSRIAHLIGVSAECVEFAPNTSYASMCSLRDCDGVREIALRCLRAGFPRRSIT